MEKFAFRAMMLMRPVWEDQAVVECSIESNGLPKFTRYMVLL